MHYTIPPGWIVTPEELGRTGITPNSGLSPVDTAEVKRLYPPNILPPEQLLPFRSAVLDLNPGEQKDFEIKPDMTRTYMQTLVNRIQ